MKKFTPTAAQASRYADYAVKIVESSERSFIIDGSSPHGTTNPMRAMYRIERIPSRKRFVVVLFADIDDKHRRQAEQVAARLASGYWAEFPARFWFRRKYLNTGRLYFRLHCGSAVEDPLIDLELQMMLDQELSRWQNETQPNPEHPRESNVAEAPKW